MMKLTLAFKLGYENFSIPYEGRQKWKLLWKYFDLLQAARQQDLDKVVGDKP